MNEIHTKLASHINTRKDDKCCAEETVGMAICGTARVLLNEVNTMDAKGVEAQLAIAKKKLKRGCCRPEILRSAMTIADNFLSSAK